MKLFLNLNNYALRILIGFAVIASSSINSSLLTVSAQTVQTQQEKSHCCNYWEPNWIQRDPWKTPGKSKAMRGRQLRHWVYLHEGIPDIYKGSQSNLQMTKDVIEDGGKLYTKLCISCHGRRGLGDGVAGKSLSPSPALLAYLIQNPASIDEYLLWSISDGGEHMGTAMPAFHGKLSRNQIWEVIAYMRAGFRPISSK